MIRNSKEQPTNLTDCHPNVVTVPSQIICRTSKISKRLRGTVGRQHPPIKARELAVRFRYGFAFSQQFPAFSQHFSAFTNQGTARGSAFQVQICIFCIMTASPFQ
jgi:hypothetical protein